MDYTKTKDAIDELPEEQKPIALSLLKDIEYWSKKVDELQGYETFETKEVSRNGMPFIMARKTPVHDMLKEAEQQKINAMRTLVQIFNKQKILDDESPLAKALEEYA